MNTSGISQTNSKSGHFDAQSDKSAILSTVLKTASDVGLSPLVGRIAVILADIAGRDHALQYIRACQAEDNNQSSSHSTRS